MDSEKLIQEATIPYVVEAQVKVHIPLSALFEAVEGLSENGLRQLRQWVDERLAALSAKMDISEGKPGQTLAYFAGWIPPDDLILMQEAIESGCERVDISEWQSSA